MHPDLDCQALGWWPLLRVAVGATFALLACGLGGGCHRILPFEAPPSDGSNPRGDGAQPDSARDGREEGSPELDGPAADRQPGDSLSTTSAWKFGPIEPLNALNSESDDDENFLTADGLTIYFSSRRPGGATGTDRKDIYVATRPTKDAPFGAVANFAALNSDAIDSFSTTADGLVGFLVTSRADGLFPGTVDIWIGTRDSTAMPWAIEMYRPDFVLSTGYDDWDVFTSLDGLRLYYSPQEHTATPAPQRIVFAERASRTASFSAVHVVEELGEGVADVTLSADELLAVFTSYRTDGPGAGDLWYAVRSNRSAKFSAPKIVPDINTPQRDGEPFLSADGTELYFASERPGGKGSEDLYRVKILERP